MDGEVKGLRLGVVDGWIDGRKSWGVEGKWDMKRGKEKERRTLAGCRIVKCMYVVDMIYPWFVLTAIV